MNRKLNNTLLLLTLFILSVCLPAYSQQQIKSSKTHELSTSDTEFQGSKVLIKFTLPNYLGSFANVSTSFVPTYQISSVTVTNEEGTELQATELLNTPVVLEAGRNYQFGWDLDKQGILELYGIQQVKIRIGYTAKTKKDIENYNNEVFRKNRRQGTIAKLFGFNRDDSRFSVFGGFQTGYLLPDFSMNEGYSVEILDQDATMVWYFGARLYFTNYFSVQVSPHFYEARFKYEYTTPISNFATTQHLNYTTVQVPVVANLHLGPRTTLFGGMYLSRIDKAEIEELGRSTIDLMDERIRTNGELPFVERDHGYIGGIEYKVKNIAIGGKYERGLQNLFNGNYNSADIPSSTDGRTLYHNALSIYLTWFLF